MTAAPPPVSVAVVGICGPRHIARCLDALASQRGAPDFEIIVAYGPALGGAADLGERYPDVSLITSDTARTPPELAARAIRGARGELILLTEDHCIPDPDWVAALYREQAPHRAAVGGAVETEPDTSAIEWAVYFVDFFRYMPPVPQGASSSLTHCNISYRRSHLDAIADVWQRVFDETAVNSALRARFGDLWLTSAAVVRMRRNVRFVDAVRERYAFGRLFGSGRVDSISPWRRVAYALLAPALPPIVLGRMAGKALQRDSSTRSFVRALPALTVMVVAWAVGEWLGYITAQKPAMLFVAPEINR